MNKKFIASIACIAVACMILVVALYINTFGTNRSLEHATWGMFGDYFGGILNPVFALGAFLGVLWSLDMQTKQLKQLSLDKQGGEILVVVKDIDTRIGELLMTSVGLIGQDDLFIHHMVSESERGASSLKNSDSYIKFVSTAKQSGTLIEASIRELRNQIIHMQNFLARYPQVSSDSYAPIVEYYINKTRRIIPMLHEIERLPNSVFDFFMTERARKNSASVPRNTHRQPQNIPQPMRNGYE